MESVAKAAVFTFVAQAMIVSAVGLISGQFLPQTLAPFYAATNSLGRTVITAVTLFPLGNFLIAYAFGHYNPAYVAPLVLVFAVLCNVAFAFLVMGGKFSWQLGLAVCAVMASCAWVSLLLQQKA